MHTPRASSSPTFLFLPLLLFPPLIYTSAIFAISSTVLSSLPRYNDISPSTGGYYYSSPSYRYIPNAYTGIHANISREYRYSSDTNYLYSSPVIIQLPKHDCSIDLFRPMRRFDLERPRNHDHRCSSESEACLFRSFVKSFFRVL